MNVHELQALEVEESAAKELIEMATALQALEKNKHFKLLVKGILEDLPVSIAAQWNNYLDMSPSQKDSTIARNTNQMIFVSAFREHLNFIHTAGNHARRKLEQIDDYRQNIEAEESAQ